MQTIEAGNQISVLQVSWMDLNGGGIADCLAEILEKNYRHLIEFDISHSSLTLKQLKAIAEALPKSENLQTLSFRGVNLLQRQLMSLCTRPFDDDRDLDAAFARDLGLMNGFVEDLCSFIASSFNLQHLDLSSMGLGPKILVIAEKGLTNSRSLLSVHLTQNNLGLLDVEELLEMMGIDHREVAAQLCKSMGSIEKEDVLGKRGAPQDEAKMLTYQAMLAQNPTEPSSPNKKSTNKPGENTVLVNFLQTDVNNIYRAEGRKTKQLANHGDARILQRELQGRLVIQRKMGFPMNIFNDQIQS